MVHRTSNIQWATLNLEPRSLNLEKPDKAPRGYPEATPRLSGIFVTQDDAGGEPDHVDAQRSVLLVISPWARRGYVSHRHTTIVSMHRTLYQIFGLPPLNMFDALANDLADGFTTQPDFRPYQCLPVDPRIFDPEKAKDPNDPDYGKARKLASFPLDDPAEVQKVLRRGEVESKAR